MCVKETKDVNPSATKPFERVCTSTHSNQLGIPIEMKEEGMAMRKCSRSGWQIGSRVQEFYGGFGSSSGLAGVLGATDMAAKESIGVYRFPFYELIKARGTTVYLVNARCIKNVLGCNSDVLDCQWLQLLFSVYRSCVGDHCNRSQASSSHDADQGH